jgi:Zn-dependent protease
MTEQQERVLIAGLKALSATTRGASASPWVERAVLAAMVQVAHPRPAAAAKSRAWLPLAAALVIASGGGAWLAHTSTIPRSTTIRPAGFIAVPGAASLPPVESGAIVRVAMPVAELPSYGIAIIPELIDGSVQADLFIAQDGHPRAIRLVNDMHSSRSTP